MIRDSTVLRFSTTVMWSDNDNRPMSPAASKIWAECSIDKEIGIMDNPPKVGSVIKIVTEASKWGRPKNTNHLCFRVKDVRHGRSGVDIFVSLEGGKYFSVGDVKSFLSQLKRDHWRVDMVNGEEMVFPENER